MRLKSRLLFIILAALCRKRNYTLNDESILRFTVMPWDCVMRFVGNDRYHAFMDLGRMDLIIRIGWWRFILKKKWEPFVRTADIRYGLPLKMFQHFILRTRIIYWDRHHFWMSHSFEHHGRIVATAISKNVAKNKQGVVTTQEALNLLNLKVQPPASSAKVNIINENGEILKKLQLFDLD